MFLLASSCLLCVCVEIRMLSAPTCVYCSYQLYGSVLPYSRSFARAHQDSETHRKRVAYRHESGQQQEYNSPLTYKYNPDIIIRSHLIKYNVIISSPSFSSSQVSLYGPPLNQLCQDNLPLTSNIPRYHSQVPLSGVHLLNHARMTYTSTKNVLHATQPSTISHLKTCIALNVPKVLCNLFWGVCNIIFRFPCHLMSWVTFPEY